MSEPRILHENILNSLKCEASGYDYPFSLSGALNSLTYEYWKFSDLQQYIIFTNSENENANCLGILATGLAGSTITIAYSNDGLSYTNLKSELFIEDGAQMIFLDEEVSYSYFKISFSKALTATTYIKNLSFGVYLEFERCLMKKHAPGPYQRKTNFKTNFSGTGNFIGRSVQKLGIKSSINFQMISSGWARSDFQSFVKNALKGTYYLAWNPEDYPSEVVFGWNDEDIPIEYTGDANLMSASWTFKGYALDRSKINITKARITADGLKLRITSDGKLRIVTGV